MAQLNLTNVINISVLQAQAGIGSYNTSNLAIFTKEAAQASFGTLGFKAYVDPTGVATDFGTGSKTYSMALAVFSQQPNILTGGGQLIVILMNLSVAGATAIQHLAFSTVPTAGKYQLGYAGAYTADILYSDNAAAVQTKLQAVADLGSATVAGSLAGGFDVTFTGVTGPAALLTVRYDTLQDTNTYDVFVTPTTTTVGVASGSAETLDAAITRTASLVQYFGILQSDHLATITSAVMLAAAAVAQALNKIAFFVSYTEADIQQGGMIDLLRSGGFTKSRGLYYGDDTNSGLNALIMAASYAGRALSVNFSGSNTTSTMHLKDLSGVQPDPSMTQTIYNEAAVSGADIYASLQGVAKVICNGANKFFDQVYNSGWLVGALQVAGFNFLAQSNTKIPQTEGGMDGLKGAYRAVCEQGITNQYGARGTWTSPTVFGVPADLIANIAQRGYYIYSQPISQQSQTDRQARKAPLIQIAFKEAGAVQESDVIVNINA